MSKHRFRNKKTKTLTSIISAVVAVVIIFAAVAIFAKNDNTSDLDFSIGGLSDVGTYVKSDETIYTKESFECSELKFTLDFDSEISYQVFFYDDMDEFVSSSEVYTKGAEIALPEGASRARIEITPIWSSDIEKEDRVIKWYNILTYADQLNVEIQTVGNEAEEA